MHLFLIGFMAAGKTTIGRLLADAWQRPFVDLDQRIEERAGVPIREIFETRGESAFRDLEARELAAVAAGSEPCVVATGGGIVGRADNRDLLRRAGVCVWLQLPFAELARRASGDPEVRPLFDDLDAARVSFEERVKYYQEADYRVDVEPSETPVRTVERVRHLLAGREEAFDLLDTALFCHPAAPRHTEEERHCAI